MTLSQLKSGKYRPYVLFGAILLGLLVSVMAGPGRSSDEGLDAVPVARPVAAPAETGPLPLPADDAEISLAP